MATTFQQLKLLSGTGRTLCLLHTNITHIQRDVYTNSRLPAPQLSLLVPTVGCHLPYSCRLLSDTGQTLRLLQTESLRTRITTSLSNLCSGHLNVDIDWLLVTVLFTLSYFSRCRCLTDGESTPGLLLDVSRLYHMLSL